MKHIFILFICITSFVSCKKNDTGGNATIVVNVGHHGHPINSPTVYVKFNVHELPSEPTSNYNLKLEGHHENHVHIEGLRYGQYYLYATGFDSTIMLPVKGGIPLKIMWSDRNEEVEITIPVTE